MGLVLSLALGLSACGGGGSSPAAPEVVTPPPPPPVTSTPDTFVTVQGEIQGFGSVIVNGKRYGTDNADVRVDGRNASLSDLSVGQIVALRARRSGDGELPQALRVRYEEVLEGPVESVADDRRSLVILGQTVFLTDDTVFEDLDPEDIAVDVVLEVSGSFTADGDIVASYVELSDDVDGDYEVHGTVGALDEAAQTFRIKGLKVSYANAQLEDFDDGETLGNGDRVEVEGSTFLNDGTLVATRVEFEGDDLDDLDGDEDDDDDEEEAEIEGFITAFADPTDFEVDGVPVVTTSGTEFEGCAPEELGLDVRVEVEGTFDDDGVLVADEVECDIESDIRLRGAVDAVDAELGAVTVFGVTGVVTEGTKFKDTGPDRVREFGLDDLAVDDRVELRGYFNAADELILTMIQRGTEGRFERDEVRGRLDSVGEDDTLVVSGVPVAYDGDTEFGLEDDEDDGITPDAFFAQVVPGDPIRVRGTEGEDGVLLADRIDREDDDDDEDDD